MIRYFLLLFILILGTANADLFNCCNELENTPYYEYPYGNLENILEEEGKESIKIFSYGSLMNKESASRTLSEETLSSYRPAIAFGIKRVFSRDVPIKPNSRWGQPNDPEARGMLNVEVSHDFHTFTNGVVFEVKREEIKNILDREEGYDLMPILVIDWDDAVKNEESKCYIAYTFHAPPGSKYHSPNINPRPGYYELTRDATKHNGSLYHYLWFNNTYMPDGVTPISEWENQVKSSNPLTQSI